MSQVKLTLRPPPNVDFVHGYPGIPPGGPERPQAAVKGAIEVRCLQGVKAKWLRIELRKVETLPAGGILSTFYDFVGPSPVNLWTSSDEYDLLRTQDFPFSIRIPESIPPSVMLENRAGIQYELVASLCTKGKKNFFRKRKSVVVSTQAAIIIDKHELHSTWPVYNQHETRHTSGSGCTLLVDRDQTCYGPGDRISLAATLRSDTATGGVLRGFELSLRETTIFNPGPHGHGGGAGAGGTKKGAVDLFKPKTITICETKLAVNAPLILGAKQRAELACALSANHTTTTLNAARHIDVTYVLSVRAVLDGEGMQSVALDLPVVISNWQRNVSEVAIKRIGPAPGLSLIPIQHSNSIKNPISTLASDNPTTTTTNTTNNNPAFNTAPANGAIKADELGYGIGAGLGYTPSLPNIKPNANTNASAKTAHQRNSSVGSGSEKSKPATGPTIGLGRRSNSEAARLTVVNALPDEIPEVSPDEPFGNRGGGSNRVQQQQQQQQQRQQTQAQTQQAWLNARDEKMLYEAARARVDQVQGYVEPTPAAAVPVAPAQPSNESVEDEKIRYERARQAALGTQGVQAYGEVPRVTAPVAGGAGIGAVVGTPEKKTGAALYTQAITARNQALAQQQQGSAVVAVTPSRTGSPNANANANNLRYLSAEQEKEALKRYEQAKLAVDRVQKGSAPIAYEHLYPDGGGSGGSSAPPPVNDLPPPFEGGDGGGGGSALSAFEEKERLKKQYEQQDAVNTVVTNAYSSPPPSPPVATNGAAARSSPPPPSFTYREPVGAEQIKKALSEKEILRRKYEAEDGTVQQQPQHLQQQPTSPQRSGSASVATTMTHTASLSSTPVRSASGTGRSVRGSRPQPSTPTTGSASGKVMTAAEEKALLKARWAAQDGMASGQPSPPPHANGAMYTPPSSPGRPGSSGVSVASMSPAQSPRPAAQPSLQQQQQQSKTPPAPPPLMPRPPAEYIQETQEEDARVSRVVGVFSPTVEDDVIVPPSLHHRPLNPARAASPFKSGGLSNGSLDVRPFSPFNPALGHSAGVNGA